MPVNKSAGTVSNPPPPAMASTKPAMSATRNSDSGINIAITHDP